MGSVSLNLNDLDDAIRDNIEGLVKRSQGGEYPYSPEQGEADIKMWHGEAHKSYDKVVKEIEQAIGSLPNWGGSQVTIVPYWSGDSPINWFDADEPYVSLQAEVKFGRDTSAPSFTIFPDNDTGNIQGVDDVLDAGDTDFFHDPATEADYFMLAEELKHPGAARRLGGKVITLYTARPSKDRRLYENAKHIPVNVFLTTSEDEAYGYIADSGGGRDVYKVRVKRMYLVETLDAGSKKNYQTFSGSGHTVPVEDCELVYEDPQTKVARRVLARWRSGP